MDKIRQCEEDFSPHSQPYEELRLIALLLMEIQTRLTRIYTVLQKYEYTGLKQNLLRSITLDIITRVFDNAAFVCIHVVERFSKDFSEVRGLRSRGF